MPARILIGTTAKINIFKIFVFTSSFSYSRASNFTFGFNFMLLTEIPSYFCDWECSSVIDGLLSMWEALGSISSTEKEEGKGGKKKKERERGERKEKWILFILHICSVILCNLFQSIFAIILRIYFFHFNFRCLLIVEKKHVGSFFKKEILEQFILSQILLSIA